MTGDDEFAHGIEHLHRAGLRQVRWARLKRCVRAVVYWLGVVSLLISLATLSLVSYSSVRAKIAVECLNEHLGGRNAVQASETEAIRRFIHAFELWVTPLNKVWMQRPGTPGQLAAIKDFAAQTPVMLRESIKLDVRLSDDAKYRAAHPLGDC